MRLHPSKFVKAKEQACYIQQKADYKRIPQSGKLSSVDIFQTRREGSTSDAGVGLFGAKKKI